MSQSRDREIIQYAYANGFVVCTKDSDFAEFAEMGPVPVPVVLIAVGNCSVATTENLLRAHAETIKAVLVEEVANALRAYVVEL